MRLTTKQDIEAPIADVYRILTDFDAWERSVMRHGTEVTRLDKLQAPGPGMRWASRVTFRGTEQNITIELMQMENPGLLRFAGVSNAMEGLGSLELMELSAKRTRMHVVCEVTPRTMAARILVQSLRLAKARITNSFAQRVARFAAEIERRNQAARKA